MPRAIGRVRYRNLGASVGAVIGFSVFLLIGLSLAWLEPESRAFGIALSLLACVVIARSFVAPSVVVAPEHVQLVETWRTRTIGWDRILGARAALGAVGRLGVRRFLVLETTDGVIELREINGPLRKPSVVDEVLFAIDGGPRRHR